MKNLIDVVFSDDKRKEFLQTLLILKGMLPFLIKLSNEERDGMQMMKDGRKPFTKKAFDFADNEPEVNPGAALVEGARKDYALFEALEMVELELNRLTEMVHDTRQTAGSEAYSVALIIKKKANLANDMGVPGMKTIVDELAKLFKISGGGAAPANPA
ncbi:MAG: hypothetical protein WC341_17395 [Bacteroidales bacterium]|jgi:hypothetical protein